MRKFSERAASAERRSEELPAKKLESTVSVLKLNSVIEDSLSRVRSHGKAKAFARDGWFDGRRWRFWWE